MTSTKLFQPSRVSVFMAVSVTVVRQFPVPSHFTIHAVESQNVTNKSLLVSVKSEKYEFLVTLRPLWSMTQGEAKLRILKLTTVNNHVPRVGPMHAHLGCTREASTFY